MAKARKVNSKKVKPKIKKQKAVIIGGQRYESNTRLDKFLKRRAKLRKPLKKGETRGAIIFK